MSCQARGCRYADTHVTAAHQCGRCGLSGHGQLECGDAHAIEQLTAKTRGDALPAHLHCGIAGCTHRTTHQDSAHHCLSCRKRQCAGCVVRSCPLCRTTSAVSASVYTNASCVVCFEDGAKAVFDGCRHAVVCWQCVEKLPGP